MTPEASRQMAAYLQETEVLKLPFAEWLALRRAMQEADTLDDLPEPHRSRIKAIKGLETKGGAPDLQEPPIRP
jgi:hypothetical protein